MLIRFVGQIGRAGIDGFAVIGRALLHVLHSYRHQVYTHRTEIRFSTRKAIDLQRIIDSVVLHIAESATVSYTPVGTG
jgi:hypothetical protein